MVQGTKVVGTGAVAVGSGVVQGTKAAGRATVTAGKAVVDTGAMIGSATVEGKPKVPPKLHSYWHPQWKSGFHGHHNSLSSLRPGIPKMLCYVLSINVNIENFKQNHSLRIHQHF